MEDSAKRKFVSASDCPPWLQDDVLETNAIKILKTEIEPTDESSLMNPVGTSQSEQDLLPESNEIQLKSPQVSPLVQYVLDQMDDLTDELKSTVQEDARHCGKMLYKL